MYSDTCCWSVDILPWHFILFIVTSFDYLICIEMMGSWVSLNWRAAWWYQSQAIVLRPLIHICWGLDRYSWYRHVLYSSFGCRGISYVVFFLLILILSSCDLSEMLILLHTIMFHVNWCRFMIVLCFSLSLASLFTLYIYSLTKYFIILTPLCFHGL